MSNGRQLTRTRQQMPGTPQQMAAAQQQGWTWDGSNWVCSPDFDDGFPCPPVPGFRPWFDPQTAPWYPGANAGVSFGASAPSFPIRGNFWWDGVRLHMFDGAAWVDIVASAIAGGSGTGTGSGGAGLVFVGPSAPPSPATGQEWWNGSVLQLWDGAAWHTIGPGAAGGPVATTTIMFGMTATASLTLPAAQAWGIVPFTNTPQTDPMAAWDPTSHKWTPTKAGIYMFDIRGGGNTAASGVALLKNDPGTFINQLSSDIVVAIQVQNTPGWNSVTGVAMMNGLTDYVRMWAFAADATFHATGPNVIFAAALLP